MAMLRRSRRAQPEPRFAQRNAIFLNSFQWIADIDQNNPLARLAGRWRALPRSARELTLFHILHPLSQTSRADFRPRKEMDVIGHENVVAHPPAVIIRRALPDFAQNLLALRQRENLTSPVSA